MRSEPQASVQAPKSHAGLIASRADAASGVRAGDRILEVGCGVCAVSVDIVRAHASSRVEAVTASPIEALHARAFVRQARLEDAIAVRVARYDRLPFEDGAFDTALLLEGLGSAEDPYEVLAEVQRVLRPGGRLYARTNTCFGDMLRELEFERVDSRRIVSVVPQRSRKRYKLVSSVAWAVSAERGAG